MADTLGSVAAILAGIVMYFFKWYMADPIISVIVALLIKKYLENVESFHSYFDGGMSVTIDQAEVKKTLEKINCVTMYTTFIFGQLPQDWIL